MRITAWTFAIAACVGAGLAPSQSLADSWLDQPKLPAWNRSGLSVPKPPQVQGPADPRCQALTRPTELKEDTVLRDAGWKLVGEYRGGWQVLVILATAGYDGMCRPLQFQGFVFVRGKFAGTLSPEVMLSRMDASLTRATIDSNGRLRAEYARYTASDPLCCPSRTTTVVFEVTANEHPVVRPVSVATTANRSASR